MILCLIIKLTKIKIIKPEDISLFFYITRVLSSLGIHKVSLLLLQLLLYFARLSLFVGKCCILCTYCSDRSVQVDSRPNRMTSPLLGNRRHCQLNFRTICPVCFVDFPHWSPKTSRPRWFWGDYNYGERNGNCYFPWLLGDMTLRSLFQIYKPAMTSYDWNRQWEIGSADRRHWTIWAHFNR